MTDRPATTDNKKLGDVDKSGVQDHFIESLSDIPGRERRQGHWRPFNVILEIRPYPINDPKRQELESQSQVGQIGVHRMDKEIAETKGRRLRILSQSILDVDWSIR